MMSDQKETFDNKPKDTNSVYGEAGKAIQWPVPPVGKFYRRFKLVNEEEFLTEPKNSQNNR